MQIKKFIVSNEEFNLSYLLKNLKDSILASALIIMITIAKGHASDQNLKIILAYTLALAWIYLIFVAVQLVFVTIGQNEEKNYINKWVKIFFLLLFLVYYAMFVIGINVSKLIFQQIIV